VPSISWKRSQAFQPPAKAALFHGNCRAAGTKVILGLDPLEMVLLGLTLLLIRPTLGKFTQLDGLMLLVVFVFWIALQVI